MSEVKTLKYHKPFVEYLLSSTFAFGYALLFDIFGIAFIIDSLNPIFVVIMSIALIIPVSTLMYVNGKNAGIKDFKQVNTNRINNANKYAVNKVSPYKALLHMSFFILLPLILVIVAQFLPGPQLQAVICLLFIQATTLLKGFGIYNFMELSWWSVLSTAIYLLCTAGVFIVSYAIQVVRLRNNATEIVNEIRNVG